jgi:hypothetical protein
MDISHMIERFLSFSAHSHLHSVFPRVLVPHALTTFLPMHISLFHLRLYIFSFTWQCLFMFSFVTLKTNGLDGRTDG